jgi:hypothetical protein
MSKILNISRAGAFPSRIDFNNSKAVLYGLSSWHVEFSLNDLSWDNNFDASTGFFTIVSPPTLLFSVSINRDGTFTISATESAVETLNCVIPVGNSTFRMEFSPTGNVFYVNGAEVVPTYSTGSASTSIAVPNPIIGDVSLINISASVSSVAFGDITNDLALFRLTDGEGTTAHESIGGLDETIQNPTWKIENSHTGIVRFPIFSEFGINFPTPPTDEQWAMYVDSAGDAIKHDGDWSAYSKDDIFRNPDFVMNIKPITCLSIWSKDSSTYRFPATLLSARHVLLADHVGTSVGTEFTFSDLANNKQTVTLLDKTNVAGDLTVGILSADITLDVDYATFLPASFVTNYLSRENADLWDLPAISPSKEGIMSFDRCLRIVDSGVHCQSGLFYPIKSQSQYGWNSLSINADRTGDSQRPNFIYHGNTLFICGLNYQSGTVGYFESPTRALGAGRTSPSVNDGDYMASIKTTMDALDATHTRTPSYDLIVGVI